MKNCPLNNFTPCNINCAWYHYDKGDSCAITSLAKINSKLLKPNLEEIEKTKEINTAIAINNIEVQKKTASLLDECQDYIKKEKAKSQRELERWDT